MFKTQGRISISKLKKRGSDFASPIGRRRFLQLATGGLAWLFTGTRCAVTNAYRVGVGKLSDPYAATIRAIESTGEWPFEDIFGKTVVIKPNLAMSMTADTGATTDPEVVRALVDLSLEAEAKQILIVEGGFGGANFSACGYDLFNIYNQRVKLVDLNNEPLAFVEVPDGLAYYAMYIPKLLLSDDVLFISAAKLKAHFHTHASLTMKNLIGLLPVEKYRIEPYEWLVSLHQRGINQVITDLNLIRPIDYAVVDGVWGMEGEGPVQGNPVHMETLIAGRNPLAVDRVCLSAMGFPQTVQHVTYAALKGLGPLNLDSVEVFGDLLSNRAFRWPATIPPPITEYPKAMPRRFTPGNGREVSISYKVAFSCLTLVEIVLTSELSPRVVPIHILHDWESRPPGFEVLKWDGRDDSGDKVLPGRYTIRVWAKYEDGHKVDVATGWVWITV